MRFKSLLVAAIWATTTPTFAQQVHPTAPCVFDGFGTNPALAEIVAAKSTTGYFGCTPDKHCLPVTLAPGDPFLVSRAIGEWTCGYFSHRNGSGPGWVRSKDIRLIDAASSPSADAWLGIWHEADTRVVIQASATPGKLNLEGTAEWHGLTGVVHTGEFAAEAVPAGNHLHVVEGDTDSCTIDLTLIGKYIVADDNNQCGGMNVRFAGILEAGRPLGKLMKITCRPASAVALFALALSARSIAQTTPGEIKITDGPLPIQVLSQGPADTVTDLQIICLFQSNAQNTLHGSLIEMNQKLGGLLDRIRTPLLFRGDLGETILITPPPATIAAKRLLIIGLGSSQAFTVERMELVGSIVYREARRLAVAHPFFAPTLLDGGVTKYTTGETSEQVVRGILRAANTEKLLIEANASVRFAIQDLTYLAGPKFAKITQEGIRKAEAAQH